MPYLLNPAGRMVCIDDPKKYEAWEKTPGFTKPTEKQIKDHESKRYAFVENIYKEKNTVKQRGSKNGVYLATVSGNGNDGYGISSRQLFRELKKLGTSISHEFDEQKIGLLYHNPYSILRIESPYRMIYTMFESTKIPDDWVPYLQAANKVLVPSKWCQKVFMASGVKAEVVPLGYDSNTFKFVEREDKSDRKKPFVFLHYNAFNARKGFLELFKAFVQEFKKDEPVKLILKTNLRKLPFPLSKEQYPNIDVINENYTTEQLADLCGASDCFVFPSRGEGFGITPLEAMATGMPAIVPNAHGISEYFDDNYMYGVAVESECPALYSRYKDMDVGKMVVCDVDDLRAKMRYVYEHQQEAMQKGKDASEYVKQWTFQKTALSLKLMFEEIYEKPIEERKSVNVLNLQLVK